MDEIKGSVGSVPASWDAREGPVLQEDRVREILSRLERGEGIKAIARELGVDRKTIKRWRRLGGWQPRVRGARRRRAGDRPARAARGDLDGEGDRGHPSEKLDMNQQCLSEGVANLAGSFFHCFPGSGSLTRSAINQQAGASTQWSGVVSAAAVALIMLVFAP